MYSLGEMATPAALRGSTAESMKVEAPILSGALRVNVTEDGVPVEVVTVVRTRTVPAWIHTTPIGQRLSSKTSTGESETARAMTLALRRTLTVLVPVAAVGVGVTSPGNVFVGRGVGETVSTGIPAGDVLVNAKSKPPITRMATMAISVLDADFVICDGIG